MKSSDLASLPMPPFVLPFEYFLHIILFNAFVLNMWFLCVHFGHADMPYSLNIICKGLRFCVRFASWVFSLNRLTCRQIRISIPLTFVDICQWNCLKCLSVVLTISLIPVPRNVSLTSSLGFSIFHHDQSNQPVPNILYFQFWISCWAAFQHNFGNHKGSSTFFWWSWNTCDMTTKVLQLHYTKNFDSVQL